ncbi:Uncharacterized protein APZ42_030595 [Daphnia magna]|uniref:Uncharacterized protein n=2 Tax=Daphnia magna TaxID=35525 RepID=A0A0P5QYM3_9CRUS|nr:hypothetical protein OUZ56_001320 [Daphnia magna]KZS06065.1 Uncharacterized protein APZ42_030595 [Daphnia magna]
MRFEIVCLLAFVVISAYAMEEKKDDKDRFLLNANTATISFSTFTIIKRSTTITSTLTSTTTCTTSTAALTTCTIGRRRRGLFYDEAAAQGRNRRGLFYNDEVEDKQGSTFLATDKKASDPVNEVPAFKTAATDEELIPLEVQAGFSLPAGQEGNRFLLAFGTSTITSYVMTSSTISLTAFCSSTTGFALCGNIGK